MLGIRIDRAQQLISRQLHQLGEGRLVGRDLLGASVLRGQPPVNIRGRSSFGPPDEGRSPTADGHALNANGRILG